MFDINIMKTMYKTKLTADIVSINCAQESIGAIFGITTILRNVLHVQMNGQALILCNVFTLPENDLAIKIAGRCNLSGAEKLYTSSFETSMAGKEVLATVKLVTSSCTTL